MEVNKLDISNLLSKEMSEVLAYQIANSKDAFSTANATFEELRASYVAERLFWNEGGPSMFLCENNKIKTKYGEVPVRFYYPLECKENTPALIYIHGGGFIVGNLDTHDRIMRLFAHHANVIVVGIDYTLSPEAKFPQAVEECVAVVKHLHENGSEYKIDGNKIFLAGDSGGANLSLASTLYLREQGEDISYIKSLLLYYGAYGLKDSVSKRLYGGDYDGLKKEDLDYYFGLYVNSEEDYDNIYFSCLNADLAKNVPPCYIETGELDPLCDDSVALYKILNANGIKAELKVLKGLIHSYLHYSKMMDASLEGIKNGVRFLNNNI